MTAFNEHIRVAQAMLHGHLYVEPLPPYMEHVNAGGHSYILHPVGNALLCVPFVALGIDNQQAISIILGAVSVLLCYNFTRSLWHTAFFLFGTTFLYESTLGASWNFCLVASTVFTWLALCELNRNNDEIYCPHWDLNDRLVDYRNPWRLGVFAGLAALCRYDLLLAFPVYLYLKRDARVLGGLALWAMVYVWYNYARFGTIQDHSIWVWYAQDAYRFQRPYGPLSIRYVPFNLFTVIFMSPGFQEAFPWLRPTWMGQNLLSLSPAFLLAKPSPFLAMAALTSILPLTVYANGFSQFGARYYVESFPFLIAAMTSRKLSKSGKALIAASIVLSMSQTLIVWFYGLAHP